MIGKMNSRIIIQKSTPENDRNGNHMLAWTDFYKCFAYANNLSGKEYWAAAQSNAQNEVSFVVRYCRKLSALTSENYRVLFNGEAYNISFVDNVQYRDKTIKIRAVKEGK